MVGLLVQAPSRDRQPQRCGKADFESGAGIGTLVGLYMIPGLFLAVPSGFIGRRFGDKRIVLLGLALRGKVRNWARLVKGKPTFGKDAPSETDFSSGERNMVARAAGHLAARPPLVAAAPVGVARVLADHLDSDHRTAPPAPVADRQVPRWCLASVDHEQPLSGRIYRLVEADPVTRNAVSGRRTTSWH